jgi:hypothetical protein
MLHRNVRRLVRAARAQFPFIGFRSVSAVSRSFEGERRQIQTICQLRERLLSTRQCFVLLEELRKQCILLGDALLICGTGIGRTLFNKTGIFSRTARMRCSSSVSFAAALMGPFVH